MTDTKTEKKTWKSDEARQTENNIQKIWEQRKSHKTNLRNLNKKRYFASFPYPYMNGELHLGHGFTMSKYDFICRFYRMAGYDVLQPFSFHLTGMPIMAAADKLRADFDIIDKNGGDTYNLPENSQYSIMMKMGILSDEIRKFVDPHYWGRFFPEVAKHTLKRFGISYDPSRSFITTDANPFYDRFVKWQFRELYHKNALRFGTRYDIYSVKDGQACLGHERSSGEDAVPSKSFVVMFKVVDGGVVTGPASAQAFNVYIIVMTTRPETLYGATNLWVDKNSSYEIFEVQYRIGTAVNRAYWICREYNLISLTHQYRDTDGFQIISYRSIGSIKGSSLVTNPEQHSEGGVTVYHPLCSNVDTESTDVYKILPVLAMNFSHIDQSLKIEASKGTGVVMSVPSDSPMDYLGYVNSDFQHLYGHQIKPVVRITHADYTGSMSAPDLVDKVKIEVTGKGYKHKVYSVPQKEMAKIKEFCYVTSLTSSVMFCGPYAGQSITTCRNSIVADNAESIVPYYEPDQEAVSRSGDKLIVSKMDQWFIDYSDSTWKSRAHKHIDTMTFNEESVRNSLHIAVDWLEQWPCSRTYGLGTKFPEEIVGSGSNHMIDSLSDSTIYMAFYTIYHLFEKYNVDPVEMTHEVFDYIFLLKEYDNKKFDRFTPFRDEFVHWYPFDVRVSAKDLINNHLAMCIFNHVMIWDDEFIERYISHCSQTGRVFKGFGPQRYEINGYVTVQKPGAKSGAKPADAEKMSKSKGNFKTLNQAIDLYTADSVRFTFASSSTGTDDAYFDQDLCTRMIEKFYKVRENFTDMVKDLSQNNFPSRQFTVLDEVFDNEMNVVIRDTVNAFKRLDYRTATTSGFHILQGLYDMYVDAVSYKNLHIDIVKKFIKVQLTLMYPITPHLCDYFRHNEDYQNIFGDEEFTIDIDTDYDSVINKNLRWVHKYLANTANQIVKTVQVLNRKKRVTKVTVYVAKEITDVYEKIAYIMFDKCGFFGDRSFEHIPNSSIIDMAKGIDPYAMEDPKAVNMIIRSYKHIEELVEAFGVSWLSDRYRNKISEKETLDNYLKYYLKRNTSDNYDVEIINYDSHYETTIEKISGVKIHDPVMKYEN